MSSCLCLCLMITQFSQAVLFPHLVPFLLGLIHMAMMGSIYTTIAVALERAVTVCAPFTHLKVVIIAIIITIIVVTVIITFIIITFIFRKLSPTTMLLVPSVSLSK